VLLSPLHGAAVTSIQIDGVLHEFSSIPGVREDVTDIVLNVKALALRMTGDGPKRMRLSVDGPSEVTAGMIETGHDIEVMNPELVLCTLDSGAKLNIEFVVNNGKGYVPASQNRPEDAPIKEAPIDVAPIDVAIAPRGDAPTRQEPKREELAQAARSPTRWRTRVSVRSRTMTSCR